MICFISATYAANFGTSKREMYQEVYNNSGSTIYCGCEWNNKHVDLSSCNLQNEFTNKESIRSERTEAEHIIPASWMLKIGDHNRDCVADSENSKYSAREYCQLHDKNYNKAHNDLVNLFPAVGQINADRSNKFYIEESDDYNIDDYNSCKSVNTEDGFIPRPSIRGDIARVAFYMRDKYFVQYTPEEEALFHKWDYQDPISQEEIQRNNRIIEIQGYGLDLD